MKLYHGSNMPIEAIDLKKGRKGKDFGRGFYLSADLEQAKGMAQNTVNREESGVPTITVFEIDDNIISDPSFKTSIFPHYSLEWVRFVVANRHNRQEEQLHDFDIVYGPIADDKVGVQIRRFDLNFIDEERLMKELEYKEETYQYFFGTEKAINRLTKIGVL